jgi:hypothetical protein
MLDPTSTTQYLTAESGRLVWHNPNPDYTSGTTGATFMVWLCGDHSLPNVNGYTLTAKIEVLNTLYSLQPSNVIRIVGNNGKWVIAQELYDPQGYQWLTLTGTLTADSSMVAIMISLEQTITGTVLVEEVTLTPP